MERAPFLAVGAARQPPAAKATTTVVASFKNIVDAARSDQKDESL